MKSCNQCKAPNEDNAVFCTYCGLNFMRASMPPASPMPSPMPAPMPRPITPPVVMPAKRALTWSDVSTVIGFVASIVGVFWCAIFMLPLGATCSFLGFKGNQTKGLAVAGMVISIIAGLIKLGLIMHDAGMLPEWFISGIAD